MEALREKALAKLSITALAIDFAIVLAVWKMAREALPPGNGTYEIVRTWFWLGIPFGLILHLFLCEIVLSGWSVGRFCCGLRIAHQNPASATVVWRVRRFLTILTRFGIGALNPNRLPSYNCSQDLVFSSDLAGQAPTRSRIRSRPNRSTPHSGTGEALNPSPAEFPSRIEVIAGPHKGETASLKSGALFARSGLFRIGRDAGWADLVLSRDTKVSGRHCHLVLNNGRMSLLDGAGKGKRSTNGTSLEGAAVSSSTAVPLRRNMTIAIGNSVLRLH